MKNNEIMQLHAVFFGKVQGVFLRHHIKLYADEIGVVGGVRNLDNGSVELIAQGDLNSLNLLLENILQKPGKGHIDRVEKAFKKTLSQYNDFSIWL